MCLSLAGFLSSYAYKDFFLVNELKISHKKLWQVDVFIL